MTPCVFCQDWGVEMALIEMPDGDDFWDERPCSRCGKASWDVRRDELHFTCVACGSHADELCEDRVCRGCHMIVSFDECAAGPPTLDTPELREAYGRLRRLLPKREERRT